MINRSNEDQDLRAAFSALRDEVEQHRLPDFDRMMAEATSRSVFAEARDDVEQRAVPDFNRMMAKAKAQAAEEPTLTVSDGGSRKTRGRRYRLAGAASLATAAAVAALIFGVDRGPSADAEFERMVAEYSSSVASGLYTSPTSQLLDVPGMELTRSVPSFRGVMDGMPSPVGVAPEGRDS